MEPLIVMLPPSPLPLQMATAEIGYFLMLALARRYRQATRSRILWGAAVAAAATIVLHAILVVSYRRTYLGSIPDVFAFLIGMAIAIFATSRRRDAALSPSQAIRGLLAFTTTTFAFIAACFGIWYATAAESERMFDVAAMLQKYVVLGLLAGVLAFAGWIIAAAP